MVQCGNTMLDVSGFTAAESLVVGPEGTIYSCSRNAVLGRFAPPYTQPENAWLTIPNAKVFGIALDPKRKTLYAGARGTNRVYRIPTDAPTTMEVLAPTMGSADGINGVTLGDDGAVYYGDQAGGHIYRLNPDDKTTTQVTKMPVTGANGIAFAPPPDGRLWVLSYSSPGAVTRFKVDATHAEVTGTRDSFKLPGNNADGITFDKTGTAYITAGGLYRVTPDGQATKINAAGGANVEFGAGALSCKLILWAGNPVHSMMNDVEGAIVPWHH
jgi:sugar lactone lactonase YvrE